MSAPSLFDPIKLGDIEAPNRIIMAPLTRGRAGSDFVPTALALEHYRQRASAGLIISEATGISQEGLGWPFTPGLWTDAQVEGWKPITDAVHAAGGRIMAQLWHMGRLVHPLFNDGKAPVSASATKAEGRAYTSAGRQDYVTARALRLDEIPRLIADYAKAAENAKRAGFDGVQLHSANGYLIDQFLRGSTNLRDDDYGGPVENRIRLLREVTEALIAVWGAGRVAVRFSPNGDSQGADDCAPEALFPAAAAALDALGIAFLELREPGPDGTFGSTEVPKQSPAIRKAFKGSLILNSDYDARTAQADLTSGIADAVSFGRPFISNPDLVERIRVGAEWTPDNPRTWYSPGGEGYTDYPALVPA
ncbi:alkene reductase [Sphingopyxis sp. H038]|uniref:alkene reductase n=1 Tax=unclassified Sphingopyxis TaxID=2614943 RepID=UPI000730222A|nr:MULTISPECIES: alkene reductase [unclassified Sphingopyxis]KTE04412.1 alkene reductase [Sphingopyxis sp. H012]KTE08135.1 alkene reductase [Sphingopyxis sp. H093]KTE13387.1 alkene reductase [Sphingopyxis sp. H053]KTE31226.1 alkene reductase [Sphingopyxis sp. H080]KTE36902.1 alkene reductase [Sphingopyxis sp. H038]